MTDAARGEGLTLAGVRAGYGETIVLQDVALTLPRHGVLAVLGRNGVGKTTLLSTIMGLTTFRGGSILLDGAEIAALPVYKRSTLGIALVPQEREIFRSLSVEENLVVAGRPGRWTLERVYAFFPSLAARRRNGGDQLSGGEQQMLAIGRALMGNPSILMLDEPMEGLAPVIVDAVLAGLDRIKREDRIALIIVEQHAQLALDFSDATLVLDRGRVVFSGASAALAREPERLASLIALGGGGERV